MQAWNAGLTRRVTYMTVAGRVKSHRKLPFILSITGKKGSPVSLVLGEEPGRGYSTWYWPATWLTWAETF